MTELSPHEPVPQRKRGAIRSILLFLLLALSVLIGADLLRTKSKLTLFLGPMIQFPSQDTAVITWEMDGPVINAWITAQAEDGRSLAAQITKSGNRFHATIIGLKQGERFGYNLGNTGLFFLSQELVSESGIHPPLPRGQPFRFLAFGDSGNGSNSQTDLARLMAAAKPDVIIHCGDLVYPVGSAHDYATNFFQPNADFLRRVPFFPTLGNHDAATDNGRPLLEVFSLPQNGPEGIEPERNYYFDFGDARFVGLDSNPVEHYGVITELQRREIVAPWLRKVLTECDARWKFVYYHHPFYTGSQHSAEGAAFMKQAFVKVFEDCGVDIVFCGHNHLYERTAPLREDKIVSEGKGIIYITTGAGGVSRYPESNPPPPYIKTFNHDVFSFTQVDLSAEKLHLRQIDENGKVIDEYVLTKPASAAAVKPST